MIILQDGKVVMELRKCRVRQMVVNLRMRSGGGLHLSVTSTTGTEVAWLEFSSISDFTGEYYQTVGQFYH